MTDSITITLPWPDPALSQNDRRHRMAKGGERAATLSAREYAAWAFVEAGGRFLFMNGVPRLVWEFTPPSRHRRDLPNFIARVKPSIDGIADALGIDDTHFENIWPRRFGPVIKGGRVRVCVASDRYWQQRLISNISAGLARTASLGDAAIAAIDAYEATYTIPEISNEG